MNCILQLAPVEDPTLELGIVLDRMPTVGEHWIWQFLPIDEPHEETFFYTTRGGRYLYDEWWVHSVTYYPFEDVVWISLNPFMTIPRLRARHVPQGLMMRIKACFGFGGADKAELLPGVGMRCFPDEISIQFKAMPEAVDVIETLGLEKVYGDLDKHIAEREDRLNLWKSLRRRLTEARDA